MFLFAGAFAGLMVATLAPGYLGLVTTSQAVANRAWVSGDWLNAICFEIAAAGGLLLCAACGALAMIVSPRVVYENVALNGV